MTDNNKMLGISTIFLSVTVKANFMWLTLYKKCDFNAKLNIFFYIYEKGTGNMAEYNEKAHISEKQSKEKSHKAVPQIKNTIYVQSVHVVIKTSLLLLIIILLIIAIDYY